MVKVFIDANIPMYVAGRDHPNRAPALQFLARVQRGEFEPCTSAEVLQEILNRYSHLNRKDLGAKCYEHFIQICPMVYPVTRADTDRAKELLLRVDGISARDTVHAAVMLNHQVAQIASFDQGFDHIPGIRRLRLEQISKYS